MSSEVRDLDAPAPVLRHVAHDEAWVRRELGEYDFAVQVAVERQDVREQAPRAI